MISLDRDGTLFPCSPLQWTRTGQVQIRRDLIRDGSRVLAIFIPVPAMALRHSDGRKALAAALRMLPEAGPR